MYKKLVFLIITLAITITSRSQEVVQLGGIDSTAINFANPQEYEIGGITVTGAVHLDEKVIILLTGLTTGDKLQVPGDKFSTAIENLWKQGLFEDIQIKASKIQG